MSAANRACRILCKLGIHTTKHPYIRHDPPRLECRWCGKVVRYV